jgi:cell division protein FtsW (lipid II flippase)
MKPYRQNRLRVFIDPSVDPRGSGYHVIQSITAIGSGGWF